MTLKKRIINITVALFYLATAILFNMDYEIAAGIILMILSFSYVIRGLSYIIYYISMARYAVGGKSILYHGIILLDFGLFATLMINIPIQYGTLYLALIQLFTGVVGLLRALESKKLSSKHWKWKFTLSVIAILSSVMCFFNMGSAEVFVDLYTVSLMSSAIELFIGSFKRTAIVYIQ